MKNNIEKIVKYFIIPAIILILTIFVLLAKFAAMTEDAKKTKVRQDITIIVESVKKYNELEGAMVEELRDLRGGGKTLTNIDPLLDSWGNSYELDPYGGYVFSKGPDGKMKKDSSGTINWNHKLNKDNMKLSYIGALALVDAKIEVDPLGESNPELRRDILHLYFNKLVKVVGDININGDSVSGDPENDEIKPKISEMTGKTADAESKNSMVFRWCRGSKNKYVSGDVLLLMADPENGIPDRDDVTAGSGTCDEICVYGGDATTNPVNPKFDLWNGEIPENLADGTDKSGKIYDTDDHREIVIVLPAGSSGSIIPGSHYINLTGNRKSGNPIFKEFDGVTGGEMSQTPVQIKVYD